MSKTMRATGTLSFQLPVATTILKLKSKKFL